MTGSELRDTREAHGLSQAELAKLLAVSQATVSRWEDGERRMTRAHEKLVRIILAGLNTP